MKHTQRAHRSEQAVAPSTFTPSGSSAFDECMRRAKELFPQPLPKQPETTYPWHGALDRLMRSAPELSPAARETARREIAVARYEQLRAWLSDRAATIRNRGCDAEIVGHDVMLSCRSCGAQWLEAAGAPLTDDKLRCPGNCNSKLG